MSDIFVKKMKNVDILKKKNSLLYELLFKHFYRFSALNPYKITDKKWVCKKDYVKKQSFWTSFSNYFQTLRDFSNYNSRRAFVKEEKWFSVFKILTK